MTHTSVLGISGTRLCSMWMCKYFTLTLYTNYIFAFGCFDHLEIGPQAEVEMLLNRLDLTLLRL